jgi:fructokinase
MGSVMRTLAFGEVLWDIIKGKEYIGGAPFNVASHLAEMGADSAMVSAVGKDDRGVRALKAVREKGVIDKFIIAHTHLPTGIVAVELDSAGKPTYDIREGSAWDSIELSDSQMKAIETAEWDIVAFGSLAQRTERNRKTLAQVLAAASPKEIFCDVNLRLDYYSKEIILQSLEHASILKLNDEEVPVISNLLYGKEILDCDFCAKMAEDWSIHTTAITRGKDGASVCRGDHYIHVPVIDVSVVDTVGAGDSFSAAFLFGLFYTDDIEKAANLAALVSSFVASESGAIPLYDEPVKKAIERVHREATENTE